MSEIDIPSEWNSAAERIIRRGLQKVLVLGAADTGKSTFCRFLNDFLLQDSSSSVLIDADVGQKIIGPPACITSGNSGRGSEKALTMGGCYFVGDVTPVRHFLPMLVGVADLSGSVEAGFQIINTTGLVHGIGRPLKDSKIQAIKPDVIVAIQRAKELEALLRSHRNSTILRVPVSPKAVVKTPVERRLLREKAFVAYFRGGVEHQLKIDRLIFQRSLIFNGRHVRKTDFIYCEKSAEGILAVTEKSLPRGTKIKTIKPGFEKDLLCGVADKRNSCIGLARLQGIDFRQKTIRLVSPVEADRIAILQCGSVYVDDKGKEERVKFQF